MIKKNTRATKADKKLGHHQLFQPFGSTLIINNDAQAFMTIII